MHSYPQGTKEKQELETDPGVTQTPAIIWLRLLVGSSLKEIVQL